MALDPSIADPLGLSGTRIDLTKSHHPWPRKIKIKRAIWQLLIRPFYMQLPRRDGKLRIKLLRLMGADIGDDCLIEPRVDVLMPWNLTLASHVAIGRDVEIYNYAPVKIGHMSLISQYSYLCTGSHDYTHPHMPLTWKPITIGSECWVAAGCFISPGVTLSNGIVIGAMSVVTKDLPEWSVCAGNPAKFLKPRSIQEI